MENKDTNIRTIRLAESVDGRDWDIRPDPVVTPGPAEGQNAAAGDLWEWDGQLYVIYHGSTRTILARTIDPTLTEVGEAWTLYASDEEAGDSGAAAAPQIETDDSGTYLYYESGDRLGGTIAYAKQDPDAQRPPGPAPDEDPLRELCSGAASDEFDGDGLGDELWPTRIREDASRHSVGDGTLTVPTYASGLAGTPLALQDLQDGEWEVTTKMTFPEPTETFQQAGLVLYGDDDNYVRFALGRSTPGLRLDFMARRDGSDDNRPGFTSIHPPAGLEDTFYLRLTSDGSALHSAISVDGEAFTPWAEPIALDSMPTELTGIGPYAMKGDTDATEVQAEYDWLRWTPSEEEQAACEDGTEPEEPEEPEPTEPEPTEPEEPEPSEPEEPAPSESEGPEPSDEPSSPGPEKPRPDDPKPSDGASTGPSAGGPDAGGGPGTGGAGTGGADTGSGGPGDRGAVAEGRASLATTGTNTVVPLAVAAGLLLTGTGMLVVRHLRGRRG